jgi:dCMP deaminase
VVARIDPDRYFLGMALLVAQRGTCIRRQVGCVLVDSRNHVLATGYNGVASGMPHCIEFPCGGQHFESGEGLEACEAIHAEQNALLQCRDVWRIDTCYATVTPCIHCVKLLLNTSCQRIVASAEYPNTSKARIMWLRANRSWEVINGI